MVSIDQDPLLLKYFKKRHLEPSTQTNYYHRFKLYYQATGLTPTTAIQEADEDEENQIRLIRRRIVDHLDTLETYLEENGYTERTLTTTVGIIRSFYNLYGIQLPPKNRRPPNPTREEALEDLPDTSDIKLALKYANVKYKAMIILMASSGMRQGDVRGLTLQNFTDSIQDYCKVEVKDLASIDQIIDELPEKVGPLVWRDIWMLKKKRYYTAFSSNESLEYILAYLRVFPPKRYHRNIPLFRNPWKDKSLSRPTLNIYFQYLNTTCGFPERKPIYFRPQNLRKWFGNQLKKYIGYIETRQLLGHRIQDETGSRYLKPDYEHLRKLYYKSMDAVTLYGKVEVHDITDDRVQVMEENYKQLLEILKMQGIHIDDLRKYSKK